MYNQFYLIWLAQIYFSDYIDQRERYAFYISIKQKSFFQKFVFELRY